MGLVLQIKGTCVRKATCPEPVQHEYWTEVTCRHIGSILGWSDEKPLEKRNQVLARRGTSKKGRAGTYTDTRNISFFFSPDHSADTPLCFRAAKGKIFSWQLEVEFFH